MRFSKAGLLKDKEIYWAPASHFVFSSHLLWCVMGKILMRLSLLLQKFLSDASRWLTLLFISQIRVFCYPVLLWGRKVALPKNGDWDRLDWHWLITIYNSFFFLELIFLPSHKTLSFLAQQHAEECKLVYICRIVSVRQLSLCMDLIVLVT